MDAKKKKIIGVAIAIIMIVVVIVVVAVNVKNGESNKETQTTTSAPQVSNSEQLTFKEDETKKSEEGTNYWDNVEVREDANEKQTDKNGEVILDENGEPDDGWSPLVPAEDLE